MAVTLTESILARYERFSLYNSPYPAHDGGRAIDLYPGTLKGGRTTDAPSPVSGTVLETRAVRAPSKPYAPEHDHLIVIAIDDENGIEGSSGIEGASESADPSGTDDENGPRKLVGRILHVDPAVEADDRVRAGESLGTLIRSGFFAPWVDNHLHVGFRRPDQNPVRASGSLPLEIGAGVDITPLEWDGTGTVVEVGETYAILDSPTHPNPGASFAGIRADGGGILDGGFPHYDGGGILESGGVDRGSSSAEPETSQPGGANTVDHATRSTDGAGPIVSLNGNRLGTANGRTVTWDDVAVTVDGQEITGLSLFCARDAAFGAKLVCPDRTVSVGQRVRVRIESRN